MTGVVTASPISDLIDVGEVVTSAELANRVMAARGLSRDSARQVISRARDGNVWTLPITLPGRARLFALRDSQLDAVFYRRVASLLATSRPGIARAINALLDRHVLLRPDAQRLLAAPNKRSSSRNHSYEHEVGFLKDLRVCQIHSEHSRLERLTRFGVLDDEGHALAQARRAQLIVEEHLAGMLLKQMREQNILSWNGTIASAKGRGVVSFNEHAFSAYGFSYLEPIMRRKEGDKPKPAPAVLDVYARTCSIGDVEGLLHRIQRIFGNPKTGLPVLGILAAFDFAKGAWEAAKRKGLWVINLRQTLGEPALEALIQAETLFRRLGEEGDDSSANDIGDFANTLDALRIHPHVALLRSVGFEIAAAALVQADGFSDVGMGELFPWKDSEREVDVVGKRKGNTELFLVECKGEYEGKPLGSDRVRKFFAETVPAVLKRYPESKTCRAEIWTTGEVGTDASEMLSSMKLQAKVSPRLLGLNELIRTVPPNMEPCKELLSAISLPV